MHACLHCLFLNVVIAELAMLHPDLSLNCFLLYFSALKVQAVVRGCLSPQSKKVWGSNSWLWFFCVEFAGFPCASVGFLPLRIPPTVQRQA